MITIVKASSDDFETITDIAYQTWPITYGNIISKDQLEFMLDKFYSTTGLQKNLEDGHCFLVAKEDNTALGFASYVHNYPKKGVTKIPKIYMLPKAQGKGIGKMLIDEIGQIAMEHGIDTLTLNVNRFNNALVFYKKIGFKIVAEEDIALEHGYLMEDYIMEKKIG